MAHRQPKEAIALEALGICSPDERVAYLNAACGNDRELRAEVDRLIETHSRSCDLLDVAHALPVTVDLFSRDEIPGTIVTSNRPTSWSRFTMACRCRK
jgi:hypothetical protein